MPPKARTTREDIINAGFEIVRRSGGENLNVRAVAAALGCSTQPVMYHYRTVDELKADIYAVADNFHTEYIMNVEGSENPSLTVGLNYIKFAAEESNLFRFLFQSEKLTNSGIDELISAEGSNPIVFAIARRKKLSVDDARRLFETLFYCAHGLATFIANKSAAYDEDYCREIFLTTLEAHVNYMKSEQTN